MPTDLELVRAHTNTVHTDFSDDFISELLVDNSVYAASALVWSMLRAKCWKKVSVAAGSNRIEAQQAFDHAKEMFETYSDLAGGISNSEQMESVTMAAQYDVEWSEYSYTTATPWWE